MIKKKSKNRYDLNRGLDGIEERAAELTVLEHIRRAKYLHGGSNKDRLRNILRKRIDVRGN